MEDPVYTELISADIFDKSIGIEVLLPYEVEYKKDIVRSRKRNFDGAMSTGRENIKPLLDTRIYDIEFPDGGREKLLLT